MLVAGLTNRVQQALESKRPTLFFVDRRGNIEDVSLNASKNDVEIAVPDLNIAAQTYSGGPYFGICCICEGQIWMHLDSDPTPVANLPEALKEALEAAQAERLRFYTERAAEFDESAWPYGSRPTALARA